MASLLISCLGISCPQNWRTFLLTTGCLCRLKVGQQGEWPRRGGRKEVEVEGDVFQASRIAVLDDFEFETCRVANYFVTGGDALDKIIEVFVGLRVIIPVLLEREGVCFSYFYCA